MVKRERGVMVKRERGRGNGGEREVNGERERTTVERAKWTER